MVPLRRRVVVLFALGLFALLPVALAGPPHYVSIDYPGAAQTFAFGINPSGDIVGSYITAGKEHGFVLRNGVFEAFDYPGATWTECWGINPQGDIVGQYGLADKTTHGFLLPMGSSVAVPIDVSQPTDLGAANTMPFKITPEGAIVGCLHQSDAAGIAMVYTMHGFVINADDVTSDPLAGSMHTGVNASGAVAGHYYITTTTLKSYVIKNGDLTWFSFSGFDITRAYDINANGDVVGFYRKNASSPFHGFLYQHGNISSIDVGFPGVTGTRAYGINPEGDIVGNYSLAGVSHGFLLTRQGSE